MRLIPVLIALLILAVAYLVITTSPEPEKRPERIDMATMWIEDKTEEGVRAMVQGMASTGANTIAVGVHDTNVIYFETDSMAIPLNDLMPHVIDEAREQGLKVYAWTDTLNFPELMDEHPDWEFVTCIRSGRYHYPSDCGWHDRLSPFSPGIDDFVREYYHDLASLDIDGIQFQDDLFLAEGEDFSDAAQYAFLEHYGHPPDTGSYEDLQGMQLLKSQRITELTRLAIDSAREVRPNITFIFDVLPEPSQERMLQWWSIDIPDIMDAGVDYIGIMSYHPQIEEEMRLDLKGSMDYLNSAFASISAQAGEDRVIYRLWTTSFDNSRRPLPEEEVSYVLERMRETGAYHTGYVPHHSRVEGYGIFPED